MYICIYVYVYIILTKYSDFITWRFFIQIQGPPPPPPSPPSNHQHQNDDHHYQQYILLLVLPEKLILTNKYKVYMRKKIMI